MPRHVETNFGNSIKEIYRKYRSYINLAILAGEIGILAFLAASWSQVNANNAIEIANTQFTVTELPTLTNTSEPVQNMVTPPATATSENVPFEITPTGETEPVENEIVWGAFPGPYGEVSAKQEIERQVGQKMDVVATFTHWLNERDLPQAMVEEVKVNDQTFVIYSESHDYNAGIEDPRVSYDAILRGDWDKYLADFGEQMRQAEVPIIYIPFNEANGNWAPWGVTVNSNSATKHREAFCKISKMYADIPNVRMGWIVNAGSVPDVPENEIAGLYPGDSCVDLVGVDGFNFATENDPWKWPEELYSPAVAILKTFDKPIYIFAVASAEGKDKPEWISRFGDYVRAENLEGFIWFNEEKERDWRIDSDPASLEAFKTMVEDLNP